MDSGFFLFGLFFLLLFIGVPIAVSVGITSLFLLWQFNLGIQVFSPNFYANIAKFPLLAIPFFILAGFLMDRVGLSRRLVNLSTSSHRADPRGPGIGAVCGCVLFGAISGTGPADTAAIGAVMIPAMVKRGYDKGFAAALVASAATTDVLIPPSVAFVVYGVITETSIGGLFAAGVIPGSDHGNRLVDSRLFHLQKARMGRRPLGNEKRKSGRLSKRLFGVCWPRSSSSGGSTAVFLLPPKRP